jgi:superfamily II DNA or RNA helicase
MKPEDQKIIDVALEGLKNFQLETVNEAYKSLFINGGRKILIADEVGLGKTIVAKGIIAKAYSDFLNNKETKKKRFHVIYICSNQALAQQNLQKLNFTNDRGAISDPINRLTYLAFNLPLNLPNFCISTLTPGTSFKLTKGKGYSSERAIIYALLTNYKCF